MNYSNSRGGGGWQGREAAGDLVEDEEGDAEMPWYHGRICDKLSFLRAGLVRAFAFHGEDTGILAAVDVGRGKIFLPSGTESGPV